MPPNSSLVENALADAFEARLRPRAAGLTVRAGPISVGFHFSSTSIAAAYARSLIPAPADVADLDIRVLAGDELDLAHLIPVPFEQGRAFSTGSYFCLWHFDERPILYLLDRAQARGLIWFAKGEVPEWELSRPGCPLIHAFLSNTPWSAVHGAAVGRNGQMLLLAGPGRAGKSTAALSCALAGWDYAGDDYVLVDTLAPRVEPLYTSARLRIDMGDAFPDVICLSTAISDGRDPRYELCLADYLDPARVRGGRLVAVLLPRRMGAQRPRFESALRAQALQALFRSTMLGAPGPLRQAATKLSSLVARAPAFFVDTGSDPRAIPAAFEDFINAQ